MPATSPVRATPGRPYDDRISPFAIAGGAALLAIALAIADAAPTAKAAPSDRGARPRPAASEPLPAAYSQIGPFCNVVIGPDDARSSQNCFPSGYDCPLAFERPIGYGMMKVRLTNRGADAAIVRSWWHVVVRCAAMDVGPYVTRLAPGETKVVSHAEPAFSYNDKVRFYRWTAEGGSIGASYAGGGCASADDRGLPGRFRAHPRAECDMGFAGSATWSPWIYLPAVLRDAPSR